MKEKLRIIRKGLKMIGGLCIISYAHLFTLMIIPSTNISKLNTILIYIIIAMVFWTPIFIFMDWREWVKK